MIGFELRDFEFTSLAKFLAVGRREIRVTDKTVHAKAYANPVVKRCGCKISSKLDGAFHTESENHGTTIFIDLRCAYKIDTRTFFDHQFRMRDFIVGGWDRRNSI